MVDLSGRNSKITRDPTEEVNAVTEDINLAAMNGVVVLEHGGRWHPSYFETFARLALQATVLE